MTRFPLHLLAVAAYFSASVVMGQLGIYGIPSSSKKPPPAGAAVSLKLPKEANVGEEIQGQFIITNKGTAPFQAEFEVGGFRLCFRITDQKGHELAILSGHPPIDYMSTCPFVASGKSESFTFPLQERVSFIEPGLYKVEACHDLGWLVDAAHPHPVASAEIRISLPSARRAAALVHTLCQARTEGDSLRLSELRHPIFLPALLVEARAGHAIACVGLAGIVQTQSTKALLELTESESADVARTAGLMLLERLPSLKDPQKAAFRGSANAETQALLRTWRPEFDAPLLNAANSFLSWEAGRENELSFFCALPYERLDALALGARFVEARGSGSDAYSVLAAVQANFDPQRWLLRPNGDIIPTPSPMGDLIRAIDALRARGWRVDGPQDGHPPEPARDVPTGEGEQRLSSQLGGRGEMAFLLALCRQLADPSIPRPKGDGWKALLHKYENNRSPVLRENVIRALPAPLPDEWEAPVMAALDDKDQRVVQAACAAAQNSRRKSFIHPLCLMIQDVRDNMVQSAASRAAWTLGARLDLWQAWCENILPQETCVEAIRTLVAYTINLPSDGLGLGGANFSRTERARVRDAWRSFLEQHREQLNKGEKVPHQDPSVIPLLGGGGLRDNASIIHIRLKDGSEWPPK